MTVTAHISGRVRVSVCGVTDLHDVEAVVDGGADAVGVIVLPRHVAEDAVGLDHARELLCCVPPYVGRYAVTHAISEDELARVAELPIDTVQLHDDVAPAIVKRLKQANPTLRLIKAVPIGGREPAVVEPWLDLVDAIIFDSMDPSAGRIGGTGLTHDWRISAELARAVDLPVVLAGGLTPENVRRAVEQVNPWAVNVNSGVEEGRAKSVQRVRDFVIAARDSSVSTLK